MDDDGLIKTRKKAIESIPLDEETFITDGKAIWYVYNVSIKDAPVLQKNQKELALLIHNFIIQNR